MKMVLHGLGLVGVMVLSGCSGSSSSSGDFPTLVDLPANDTITIDAFEASGQFLIDPVTGAQITNIGQSGEQVTLTTDPSSILNSATLSSRLGELSYDCSDPGTTCTQSGAEVDLSDADSFVRFANPVEGRFEYQTFGRWVRFGQTTGDLSSFSTGFRTESRAGLPNTADYVGVAEGVTDRNGASEVVRADVQISTDFSTATFTTSNTQVFDNGGSADAPELDLSGTLAVNGTGMTGSASSTQVAGTVDAQLYGPNGEEIGGVFVTNGQVGDYFGSFGGSRTP
ncbi:MAG: transferrin-binding protein-like solute binding protein [Pseudomonadota bacterium]